MDQTDIKLIIEAALLAAGKPLPFEKIVEVFTRKGEGPERADIRAGLEALSADYEDRGIEVKEVSSGYRIQVRSSMADWLQPLWEERAPRYTRALLETLALIAYRQPITRGEIEEVRGVAVSSNIVRTLMERGWVRVVGHRDVPGKPAMLGTTREFLDYFGLKKLEDLPTLAEFDEEHPESNPQGDFIESFDGDDDAQAEDAESDSASAETGEAMSADDAAEELGAVNDDAAMPHGEASQDETAYGEAPMGASDSGGSPAAAEAPEASEESPEESDSAVVASAGWGDETPAQAGIDDERATAGSGSGLAEVAEDEEAAAVAASMPGHEERPAAAEETDPGALEDGGTGTAEGSEEAAAVFRALADRLDAGHGPDTSESDHAEPAEESAPDAPGRETPQASSEEDETHSPAPEDTPAAGQSGSGRL